MGRLIVMRHAKSSWGDPGLSDFGRPLNGRGRKSAPKMGAWLARKGYVPELVLCSAAVRTRETWHLLGLEAEVRFERRLYHAGPGEIAALLGDVTAKSVLVIGHNPGLAAFVGRLAQVPPDHPRFADFPTCATWVAECDVDSWADLTPGCAITRDFAIPREL